MSIGYRADLIALAVALGALASPVDADQGGNADLSQCAKISDAVQRLACYDSVAGHGPAGADAASAPATPGSPSSGSSSPSGSAGSSPSGASSAQPAPARVPPADRPPAPATAAPPVSTSTAPEPARDIMADPKNFGLSRSQLHQTTPEGSPSITALVTNVLTDAAGNLYLFLDNGQTWRFDEMGASLRAGDGVTIRKAALGSFLLLTPDRRSYRVRRLK